jgi:hypothetical protein
MEISTEAAAVEGGTVDALGNLPIMDSEDALNNYLKGDGNTVLPPAGGDDAAAQAAAKKKADDAAAKAKAAAATRKPDPSKIGDEPGAAAGEGEGEGDEGGEGDGDEKKVTDYPSIVHYLNERHGLNLNVAELGDEVSKETEAEAISNILVRMNEGMNNALQEYNYIEELLKDDEVQKVLKAKSEGKALKDLYGEFVQTPQGMTDDALAVKEFKARFPKSTDEAINGMVDSLKKTGQFEAFTASLREQSVEEQRLSAERQEAERQKAAAAQAELEQRQMQEYSDYVGNLTSVYGVPLTDEMKNSILKMTTARDKEGYTYLDRQLQSNTGVVLAAIGVSMLKQMVQNAASMDGNRRNVKLMDKLFESPEKLQGNGGGRTEKKAEDDLSLLDRF